MKRYDNKIMNFVKPSRSKMSTGTSTGKKAAIAMSGGVDSTVAASLLVEEGYEVIGLWMQVLGDGPPEADRAFGDARRAAHALGIPLSPVDLRQPFDAEVITPFLREYLSGRTPNPCALCNPRFKFGVLMERGAALGARRFATGHYARVKRDVGSDDGRERFILQRGRDKGKDQSYFLWGLDQRQLSQCVFPNGELTKQEVRAMARERGLPVIERGESQEICFIPRGDYRAFLRERIADHRGEAGEIVDGEGRVLGRHNGIFGFTIGQRRGIGVPAPRPRYVLRIEPASNRVVVGGKEALLAGGLVAEGMRWLSMAPPQGEFRAAGQIRYRHRAAPCRVVPLEGGAVRVLFDEPQEAITPGQALVLYRDDAVLGGGWIRGADGE